MVKRRIHSEEAQYGHLKRRYMFLVKMQVVWMIVVYQFWSRSRWETSGADLGTLKKKKKRGGGGGEGHAIEFVVRSTLKK